MGLDQIPHNFMTARLEDVVRWGRRNSVFPATFGLACCALEMMATGAAHYDLARFGMEVFRASPRQADLMIVAGRVSQKMAPVLRQVYDQMVEPKWVISMGVCASSGGMFNNYAIVQGVDQIVPVDVYVPGCPPGPETLMHGILTLHEQIRTGELLRRREASPTGRRRDPARAAEPAPATSLSDGGEATMADDDEPLVKKITSRTQPTVPRRFPTTRSPPRSSSGSRARCSSRATASRSSTSTARCSPRSRRSCATSSSSRCASTSPRSTILLDGARLHARRRRRPSASRSSPTSCRTRATGASA